MPVSANAYLPRSRLYSDLSRYKELTTIVEMREDISDDADSLEDIIRDCGSFLTIREETIYFVHQSAKDYLVEQAAATIFPGGFATIRYSIFSRST